ncbi:MAG TPA: hypothetical protein VGQ19_21085 [Burkholderiales bacterium]|jgi:hypothetical protein|nr:hypothetical protein [Burkholderiales bacterium]
MDTEVKRKWIEALRSGRYQQTQKALRNDDGYCCLGVLCDLVDPAGWSPSTIIRGEMNHDGETGMPSDKLTDSIDLEWGKAEALAELNDKGKSFAEIADYIERKL